MKSTRSARTAKTGKHACITGAINSNRTMTTPNYTDSGIAVFLFIASAVWLTMSAANADTRSGGKESRNHNDTELPDQFLRSFDSGNFQGANALLDSIVANSPPRSPAWVDANEKKVRLMAYRGDLSGAARLSSRIIDAYDGKRDLSAARFLLLQSFLLFRSRRFERSENLMHKALSLSPELQENELPGDYSDALYWYLEGERQAREGNIRLASSRWRTLVEAATNAMPGSRWGNAPYDAMRRLLDVRSDTTGQSQSAATTTGTDLDIARRMIEAQPTGSLLAIVARLDLSGIHSTLGHGQLASLLLQETVSTTTNSTDPYMQALVLGRRAQAELANGSVSKALDLARQAVFASQSFPILSYQWEWTIARALVKSGRNTDAIDVYRTAARQLDALREQGVAPFSFQRAGQLYFELTNLILRQIDNAPDATTALALKKDALANIEKSKAAELRDYFHDNCVAEFHAKTNLIDRVPEGTAAVYPVLLNDRIEILVSTAGTIDRKTIRVGRAQVTQEIQLFRTLLEQRGNRRFLRPAKKLHQWLIEPIQKGLNDKNIHTLVWIPEGPLRTVPVAALHNGKGYLVEQFTLATTPGLTLTAGRQSRSDKRTALVGGVSDAVQGFPALRHVPAELDAVVRQTGGKRLQNSRFDTKSLGQELLNNNYSVVHFASHAKFDSDADKTFLLTFDGRIGLNRLSELIGAGEFSRKPLELLTLSACETAAGDERSALGLAGTAVKSGARSVLASLWPIDDAASAQLLSGFYTELFAAGASKASSLREAQRSLLSDRRYRHPAYWSAFILIGDWQ